MSSQRQCLSCIQPFFPDSRNGQRQQYCGRPDCQNVRRKMNQRLRRSRSQDIVRVRSGQKPTEASWLLRNPLFVGLISQLLDSVLPDDIEAYSRRAIAKGLDILAKPEALRVAKTHVKRQRKPR